MAPTLGVVTRGQIDPTLGGRLDRNPIIWALLRELLYEGVLDCELAIYDQEGCQRAALEISLLEQPGQALQDCLSVPVAVFFLPRTVAGLDRTGVSASPARKVDPYLDGAKIGTFDPYTDGANA